ncbi:MAG: hypothetical protein OMM_00983 [Candidatus Magnetoglobus multicellularis str. Araruama]|uniref:Transmembrane protein n=1 Tax=Candidatus Magnetoglobus multicellularis str. Araruama TaxID=890399 RepID=A0A1V1PEW2_9BACT|nr:MAG: hypothetical protein OMM_00983 [Candidatus Magnetoglobus multicellularis str. Araruama]
MSRNKDRVPDIQFILVTLPDGRPPKFSRIKVLINMQKCLIIAFCFGFFLGSVIMPVWTHNVESAQVIANEMNYPVENPMNIGHRGLYSLIIQIPALLLSTGFSEWTLCIIFSGIQCGIAFSTVSLITLIFSRHLLFSLAFPILLLHLSTIQPFWPDNYYTVFHGHFYPVLYPLNTSLYGLLGLCGVLLIFCFLSFGWIRTTFFLAGLYPSIHPTLALAAWIGLAASICFVVNKNSIVLIFKYFSAGFLLFGLSAVIHYLLSGPVKTELSPEMYQCISVAHVSDHLLHRSNFLSSISVLQFFEPDIYLLLIFFTLLKTKLFTPSIIRFITSLSSIIMIGCLYILFSFAWPELVTIYPINALMIHRWLNLSSIAVPCVISGLLIYHGLILNHKLSVWIIIIYIGLVISGHMTGITITSSFHSFDSSKPLLNKIGIGWPLLMVIVCLTNLILKKKAGDNHRIFNRNPSQYIQMALFVMIIGHGLIDSVWIRNYKNTLSLDARNVIDKLKKGQGILLTTEPFWELAPIQLRTNREMLLDLSQANGIHYVPQAIPSAQAIFQTVFQMDFCTPDRNSKKLLHVLESRSFQEWQTIALQYNITQILTSGSLHLNLPVCYQNKSYRIYRIVIPGID